jgi:hypothetical protein
MEKHNDIDYLNNLLHRFVYLNNDENIEHETMIYEDIPIERLKKIDEDTNKKILDSLLVDLTLHKVYDDRIELIRNVKPYNNLIVVSFYRRSENSLDDIKRGENVDKLISLILSEQVMKKKLNEVILPVMNLDINIQILLDKISNEEIKKVIKDKHSNEYEDIVSIQVKECYSKLLDDVNDKYCLIICVLNALEKIRSEYPTFRHNNLVKDNIYLMESKSSDKTYLIGKHKLSMSNVNFTIKLGNFNKASISGLVKNNDSISEGDELNDIKTFIKSLNLEENVEKIKSVDELLLMSAFNKFHKESLEKMKRSVIEDQDKPYSEIPLTIESESEKSAAKPDVDKINEEKNKFMPSGSEEMMSITILEDKKVKPKKEESSSESKSESSESKKNIEKEEVDEEVKVGDIAEDVITMDSARSAKGISSYNTSEAMRSVQSYGEKPYETSKNKIKKEINLYNSSSIYTTTVSSGSSEIYSGGNRNVVKNSREIKKYKKPENNNYMQLEGRTKKVRNLKEVLKAPLENEQPVTQPSVPGLGINTKSRITSVLGTENLGRKNLPLVAPDVSAPGINGFAMNNASTLGAMQSYHTTQPPQTAPVSNMPTMEGPLMTNLLGDPVKEQYDQQMQHQAMQNQMQPQMQQQMQQQMMQNPMMQNPMMQQQMMQPQMMQQSMMPQMMQPQMMPQMMQNPMMPQIMQNPMMEQMGMVGGSNFGVTGQRRIHRKKDDIFFLKNKQVGGVGGEGVMATPYDPRFMKNTPFKTQEQKKIEASRFEETRGPQPVIEFTVNDNILGKPAKPATIYPSPFVPIGPSVQNMYAPNPYANQNLFVPDNRYPYMFQPNKIPVINNYNIQLPGVMGDHAGLYKVFEDVLAGDEYSNTYNTLDERLRILDNLRSNLVRHNDGELIGLSGGGKQLRNLLSYIRMMELNPYHVEDDIGRNNPYRDLPSNMLLFRSCYPLQIDSRTNAITCSKNSIGMNVRVYEMRVADFFTSELGINKLDLDLWREIYHYEYLREEILKKKVSQNFVMLYSYYLSDAEKINFNKLRELRKLDMAPTKTVTDIDDLKKEFDTLVKTAVADPRSGINITLPTDKVLVALTEGPNMPLVKWAMKQYQSNGPINKMIFTGFHSDNEWNSIIFQMVAALYTMEVHKFSLSTFKLRDNLFIKDLKTAGNIVGYWKYIIEDIPYYVPNYGHLLMIDSSYKDVPGITYTTIMPTTTTSSLVYKVYSENLSNIPYDPNYTFDNFIEAVNPSNWGAAFINKGGVKPPASIMAKLQKIHSEAVADLTAYRTGTAPFTIEKYLRTHFHNYMHNRIGTLLRVTEMPNLVKDNPSEADCKPGSIFIREIAKDSQYQCVMVAEKPSALGNVKVFTKSAITDSDFKEEEISIGTLYKYSPYEHLEQNYKPDQAKLGEADMLDIYVCKK